MTDWRAVEARVCTGKVRRSAKGARTAAVRTGEGIAPYRCPFCAAWHVGHVPSMETVATIAAAIRARAQDPAA